MNLEERKRKEGRREEFLELKHTNWEVSSLILTGVKDLEAKALSGA
jgi:hypothetical protein